jgi:hypothetical protein
MQRMKRNPSHRHHKAHRTYVQGTKYSKTRPLYDQRLIVPENSAWTLLALYSNIDTIGGI